MHTLTSVLGFDFEDGAQRYKKCDKSKNRKYPLNRLDTEKITFRDQRLESDRSRRREEQKSKSDGYARQEVTTRHLNRACKMIILDCISGL